MAKLGGAIAFLERPRLAFTRLEQHAIPLGFARRNLLLRMGLRDPLLGDVGIALRDIRVVFDEL